jgi:hypothetical protein
MILSQRKEGKPTLGECTVLSFQSRGTRKMDKYKGEIVYTQMTKTKSKYSRKAKYNRVGKCASATSADNNKTKQEVLLLTIQ